MGSGNARNGGKSSFVSEIMGRNAKTGKSTGSRETPRRVPVTRVTVETAVFQAKSWPVTAWVLAQGLDVREAFPLSTGFWLARLGSKHKS